MQYKYYIRSDALYLVLFLQNLRTQILQADCIGDLVWPFFLEELLKFWPIKSQTRCVENLTFDGHKAIDTVVLKQLWFRTTVGSTTPFQTLIRGT